MAQNRKLVSLLVLRKIIELRSNSKYKTNFMPRNCSSLRYQLGKGFQFQTFFASYECKTIFGEIKYELRNRTNLLTFK